MPKVSVRGAARDAIKQDARARRELSRVGSDRTGPGTLDSFVNFAHKMGIGADNPLSSGTYGFNPITRQRTLLEWIHRGSWLGGVAIDVMAEDMTRAGITYTTELPPEDAEVLDACVARNAVWESINETIKWARLYGGAGAVLLIDGQDLSTPLRPETIGEGQFRGLLPMDRWMLEPALEDLVTEMGPWLGMPKYYRVGSNAPALRNKVVHYSRLPFRMVGIKVPYQQRLTENLWGISVIERLYDRMIAFDSATTGAAQLVYKAYLRTLSVEGLREVVAAGGPALNGLVQYTEIMRRFQSIEGLTLIDAKDKFEVQGHSAFSGLSDVLNQFAQQLSGALQIPLTRLFGQSPSGLNATGDNDMRNYYDLINQRQMADMHQGTTLVYRAAAQSEGLKLPDNFALGFRPLWQLTETDKANIAKTNSDTVFGAVEQGLISDQVALRELRQSSRTTGVWTNITTELIDAADEEVRDPLGAEMGIDAETGEPAMPGQQPTQPKEKEDAGSQGQEGKVAERKAGGAPVRGKAADRGEEHPAHHQRVRPRHRVNR